MSLLCRLGIHARFVPPGRERYRDDLYWCLRCPAQWRIGTYGYPWGVVRYRERMCDRA